MNTTRITVGDGAGRWLRGIAHAVLLLGFALLSSPAAEAQIAFRSAASANARAPVFVAASSSAGSIVFFGAGAQVATTTGASITPPLPAGWAANDFAVLIIAGRPTDTTQPAAPTGWTLRSSSYRDVGAEDLKIMTFYKVMAGSDADPVVTLPAAWLDAGNVVKGMSGQIAVWRGVNTTTPFDVADVTATNGAFVDWRPPSITTVTNGAWVVSAMATSDNNALDFYNANGFTGRMSGTSYDTTTGSDHSVGLAEVLQATAGTPTMLTWLQTVNGNDSWASITFALRPVTTALAINVPAGTVQNDVMIASIGVQPSTTATPTAPSGWTLRRRIDNGSATTNSLLIYHKTAGASEPASYSWTGLTGATFRVGGIQSFSGIDPNTATQIDIDSTGQATGSATTHATQDVTTTVASTMVVTSHTYASSRDWTGAPSGMTEAFDQPSGAASATGQSIAGHYMLKSTAGLTGTKTATAAGDADRGNAHILALKPLTPVLTITKPAGTVANDVMVAAIGFRRENATITPPSGWTLLRRTDSTFSSGNSLAVYTKVAGGSEPASYTWSFTNWENAAGGIQSFSGVDTAAAVNVENGAATADSLTHATPDITPTVANTMLVTAHTFASSATWTPPAGMTEAYDTASPAPPAEYGQAIVGSYAPHVFLATGAKSATASAWTDGGNAHILALRPLPVTGLAGGFNAYDTTTTPATAATGFIKTKIAGISTSLAIVALNWPRTAVETGFTGTVRVELLNASNNTGALDVNGCRSTWTVIYTLSPDPTYVAGDLGRKTLSGVYSNSYPDLRVRISYPAVSPTRIGCSNDNFALRPNAFTSFSVTDGGTWDTAGTTRTLNNTTLPGGSALHKAGHPFTVRATAVDGAGSPATTTNYTGAPTPTLTDCGGSSACPSTLGTVTLGSSFILGVLTANTATYDYGGSFNMQLVDSTFSAVDASDGSTTAERNITSSAISVGRFVPDHFTVALNTPAFGTACGAFNYIGQNFNYSTAPAITVTARNLAGGKIDNYAGNLWQITAASLTGKSYTTAAGTLNTGGITGTDPNIDSTTPGAGAGTLTFRSPSFFNATTGFFFTRTTPVAPFDADISLAINVIDADTISYASNPARFGLASAGNGIAFSSGKPMRFGRLVVRNANGSQLLPLPVQVEAQYWSGAPTNAFITNTLDNCTSIASANDAMGSYTGNLGACETAISGGGALNMGRRTLQLAAPGSGNTGSVNLTVNLGAAASGNTCTTQGGAQGSATTANLPHLQGNWTGANYDQNPTARATFGVSRGAEEVIFVRENF